jgi:hypothetical protein
MSKNNRGLVPAEQAHDLSESEAYIVREYDAAFPAVIDMVGANSDLERAAKAVHAEYREMSKWKKLRCYRVTPLDDDPDTEIYILHIGEKIELDWTWEGAKAFRPADIDEPDLANRLDEILSASEIDKKGGIAWHGEVVEVDEIAGEVYISTSDSERPPTTGSFYIRPFEFLETLNAIYWYSEFEQIRANLLPGRLLAARGGLHPRLTPAPEFSLPEFTEMWRHA